MKFLLAIVTAIVGISSLVLTLLAAVNFLKIRTYLSNKLYNTFVAFLVLTLLGFVALIIGLSSESRIFFEAVKFIASCNFFLLLLFVYFHFTELRDNQIDSDRE